MSVTQEQVQDHRYLVCAIYRSQQLINQLTRIQHVGIVLAVSPFSAIAIARKDHNPEGETPTSYVASIILGPFRVNAFSNRLYTCEELLSTEIG
ncbi:hypothetical protein LCGC14_1834210 [marine sediment metagenome]|uniref:Uncharacterized protein n=1 Tax=marine sediment metagenome TaxID=412755 RepID=A0A0F9GFC6_9ZZZZ